MWFEPCSPVATASISGWSSRATSPRTGSSPPSRYIAATTDSNKSESTDGGTGRLTDRPFPTIKKSMSPSCSLIRPHVSRLT
ncbi:MAG: hypothetical protein EBR28_11590, partial [Planctomycetia bacterium]|nr:hypothetical protein [Planctomycetia bacterium]